MILGRAPIERLTREAMAPILFRRLSPPLASVRAEIMVFLIAITAALEDEASPPLHIWGEVPSVRTRLLGEPLGEIARTPQPLPIEPPRSETSVTRRFLDVGERGEAEIAAFADTILRPSPRVIRAG